MEAELRGSTPYDDVPPAYADLIATYTEDSDDDEDADDDAQQQRSAE